MTTIRGVTLYQGSESARIPDRRGIYAWYYNPIEPNASSVSKTLQLLLTQPGRIRTQVEMRYGVKWLSESPIRITQGSAYRNLNAVVDQSLGAAQSLILQFVSGGAFPLFSRPLYIGIAKQLYTRVFLQHYQQLSDYWDDSSIPSRFLRGNANADVATLMEKTGLPHSFALEARICNVAIKDLLVCTYELEDVPSAIQAELNDMEDQAELNDVEDQPAINGEPPSIRPLEFLLQMLADPAFGRR
jgi:hypothetical protein